MVKVFMRWLEYMGEEKLQLYPKLISPNSLLDESSRLPQKYWVAEEKRRSRTLRNSVIYGRVSFFNGGREVRARVNKSKKNCAALVFYFTGKNHDNLTSCHVALLMVSPSPLRMFVFDPMRCETISKGLVEIRRGLSVLSSPIKIAFGTQMGSFDCLQRTLEMMALICGGLDFTSCEELVYEEIDPK